MRTAASVGRRCLVACLIAWVRVRCGVARRDAWQSDDRFVECKRDSLDGVIDDLVVRGPRVTRSCWSKA